jgi:hypothetical protein
MKTFAKREDEIFGAVTQAILSFLIIGHKRFRTREAADRFSAKDDGKKLTTKVG